MYKVYRRSIFRHYLVWSFFIPIATIFTYQRIVNGPFNIYVKGMVLFYIIMFLIAATGLNYIILKSDSITFGNSFYNFWNKTFVYKEIRKIMFKNAAHGNVYLHIITHNNKSYRYVISCVDYSDLKKIASDLKENNIELEIAPGIKKNYFH